MKAILILDMPRNCNNCPCFDCGDDRCCCNVLNIDLCNEDTRIIYKDCPLKPLPSKIDTNGNYENDFTLNYYLSLKRNNVENAYEVGWNDCISEILGEDE